LVYTQRLVAFSSLEGFLSGGIFVLPKIGGAFVRGVCPGELLSWGAFVQGAFVLDSTTAMPFMRT